MNRYLYMLLFLAGTVLSSCEHKDLCYDHPHGVDMNLVFDWRTAPDADPERMMAYFFPVGGGQPIKYEFMNKNGGKLESLPSGTYRVLCMNSDTEKALIKGEGAYDTFEVFTNSTSLLEGLGVMVATEPVRAGDESAVATPDMIWTDRLESLTVSGSDGGGTITLYPAESVTRVSCEIRNVQNLQHVTNVSGSLSGMSQSYFAGKDKLSGVRVTHPFALSKSGEKVITGEFLSFGHCPDTDIQHLLTVYAVLEDGSKWFYEFDKDDVTRQIHESPDQRHIHIVLDGLPFPKPITGGNGGMYPTVDDWFDVNVDIDM